MRACCALAEAMEDLPALVLERVASYLGDADVLSLGATCTRAREACEEEAVWRPRCEAYGIRCAVPASSGSVQRQGEGPEVEKPPAHDDPSTSPAAQQPMQQPMEADTEPDSGSEPEQPPEVTRVATGSADITPGLSCRNLYLGLLRHYGVLLTGQQPTKDLGPAAQDTASLSTLGPALWQATAMPFGGMIVAQFEAPAQIVLYSVVAYRLNGPVRGRPVLRIAARTPPPRVRRTSPTLPSTAAPDASLAAAEGSTAAGSVGTEATGAPAPAPPLAAAEQAASASGSGQQAPQAEVSGAAGAASPPRPAHLWKRLVGMLQGMLSAGGGGGGGGDGSGQESSSPAAAASQSSGHPSGSGEPGNPHPPAAQHASQHPPWPSHVTCCCQVHPGPDGMPEEHPALLRFLAVAAPSLAGPSADAGASNSASNGASNGAESSPSSSSGTGGSGGGIGSSGAGARLGGGGGGFIFHCAHFCRHTDFDPLLRHTGSLGPGVPMNLIDLPMRPHLPVAHVTPPSTTIVAAAAAPAQVASSSSNGTGADPSATLPAADPSSQGPSTVQPGLVPPSLSAASASAVTPHQPQPQPLVLSRVPELDMQYARLCSVQYIQHHTRFLRRRSGDSQESKALVYRPLMVRPAVGGY